MSTPACPKCGNNRQVWVNQITKVLTCHRAYCHTEIEVCPNCRLSADLSQLQQCIIHEDEWHCPRCECPKCAEEDNQSACEGDTCTL